MHGRQSHFHINDFTPNLTLKQQLRVNSQMASSVCCMISNLFVIIILCLRPLKPEEKQLIISPYQLTLTLKMTSTQVVKMSVTVNNNSPIQDYIHIDSWVQTFHSP